MADREPQQELHAARIAWQVVDLNRLPLVPGPAPFSRQVAARFENVTTDLLLAAFGPRRRCRGPCYQRRSRRRSEFPRSRCWAQCNAGSGSGREQPTLRLIVIQHDIGQL